MAVSRAAFNFSSMKFLGTLQKNNPVDDPAGGQIDNWTTVVTTRCSLEKQSGKLTDGAGKMEYQKNYVLVCRFQSAIVLDSDSRWLINSDVYKVMDYEEVDMKPHYYTFNVTK